MIKRIGIESSKKLLHETYNRSRFFVLIIGIFPSSFLSLINQSAEIYKNIITICRTYIQSIIVSSSNGNKRVLLGKILFVRKSIII